MRRKVSVVLGGILQTCRNPNRVLFSFPESMTATPPNEQARNSSTNPFVLKSKHGDFKKIEATRSDLDTSAPIIVTKTPNPTWSYGQGAADPSHLAKSHIEIDPFAPERSMISNYKLIISGIVPRPIGFISTESAPSPDGTITANLAPFSYFQCVDHDPPIFVVGFSARAVRQKDTLLNLRETGQCVINVVSEHMIEAVNATSLDVPYGVSEWKLSGLNGAPSTTVSPQRVREAVFSIEGRLLEIKELDYHTKRNGEEDKPHGSMAIIEGTRFWVREDALNEQQDQISLEVLRPVAQLGAISYARVRETFELPRSSYQVEMEKKVGLESFVNQKTT